MKLTALLAFVIVSCSSLVSCSSQQPEVDEPIVSLQDNSEEIQMVYDGIKIYSKELSRDPVRGKFLVEDYLRRRLSNDLGLQTKDVSPVDVDQLKVGQMACLELPGGNIGGGASRNVSEPLSYARSPTDHKCYAIESIECAVNTTHHAEDTTWTSTMCKIEILDDYDGTSPCDDAERDKCEMPDGTMANWREPVASSEPPTNCTISPFKCKQHAAGCWYLPGSQDTTCINIGCGFGTCPLCPHGAGNLCIKSWCVAKCTSPNAADWSKPIRLGDKITFNTTFGTSIELCMKNPK